MCWYVNLDWNNLFKIWHFRKFNKFSDLGYILWTVCMWVCALCLDSYNNYCKYARIETIHQSKYNTNCIETESRMVGEVIGGVSRWEDGFLWVEYVIIKRYKTRLFYEYHKIINTWNDMGDPYLCFYYTKKIAHYEKWYDRDNQCCCRCIIWLW